MPGELPEFRLVPRTPTEELDQLAAALAASLTLDERVPEPEAEQPPTSEPAADVAPPPSAADSAELPEAAGPPERAAASSAPGDVEQLEGAGAIAAAAGLWRPREIGRAAHPFTRHHRFYAVWRLSAVGGGLTWAGVHVGYKTDAYYGLLALNGGFGGISWHREDDLESACRVWWREEHKHKGLRLQGCRVYYWDERPTGSAA